MAETHAYSSHAINLYGISHTGSGFSFVCFSLSTLDSLFLAIVLTGGLLFLARGLGGCGTGDHHVHLYI